jgi:UPF0755 protein
MKRVLLGLLLLLVVAAGLGLYGISVLSAPFQGYATDEVFVDIPSGTGVNAIGRRLVDAGVVRNRWAFRLATWRAGQGRSLKAGEYRFSGALTPAQVIDRIAEGDVYLRPITFPEGLTVAEMARLYEESGLGTRQAFLEAARDPAAVRALDPEAPDLEGYLFPETYTLPRSAGAADLIAQMTTRFTSVFDETLRRRAAERGLSVRQAVTLASLVEKETSKPAERPIVSAVYHNRLRIGMGLQCDPTVIYALQRAGLYTGNLTRENLQFDSPYNTYRYRGLPPGPIAAPGRASLEAAVAPSADSYLYFVSRNDGSHVFASTLAEHNRNVQEYQVRYFRERGGAK